MNPRKIETYNELRKLKLSREQISARVIEIARQIIEAGTYKNAIGGLGRMKVLSKAVTDGYWDEKMHKGEMYECYYLLNKDEECKDRVIL